MAFTGYLSQFSLPELFRFLEEAHETGLLTIHKLSSSKLSSSDLPSSLSGSNLITEASYIWLQQGRILAAAESLNDGDLISTLTKRGWNKNCLTLNDFENSSTKTTMGLYLKSQGVVKAEQLMLLFRAQITDKISPLFRLADAQFNFEANAQIPLAEMTGLSIPATEATLIGLRNLEEWSQLTAKLPDPTSSILAKTQERPKVRLEYTESQVWKYADGNSSVQKISEELQFPLEKVQRIAFRLIISNLAEEVFMSKSNNNTNRDRVKVFSEVNTSNKVVQNKVAENKTTENKTTENRFTELQYHQNTQKSARNLVTPAYSQLSPKSKNCKQENSSAASSILEPDLDTVSKTNMSQSFLQNLVGFLQEKIEN